MNKIIVFGFFFLFNSFLIVAQKTQITKVVVDKSSKRPLENVSVYNETDNSLTNQEGVFSFISNREDVCFSLLGYEELKTSLQQLKNLDTIFLQPKLVELDEVVVGQEFAILKKAYSKLKENYVLEPYQENFFLRCILEKNNEVARLQDIYGKVSRKSIFKTKSQPDNKSEVEVLNMRKVGISEKSDFVYFKFQSFDKLFDLNALIYIEFEEFELTQQKNIGADYFKISFLKKEPNSMAQKTSGYFVIHKADYAIVETYFDFYDDPEKVPYSKDGKVEYRTTSFKRTSNYKKNAAVGKYYLNNANSEVKVEIRGNEKMQKATYDYSTQYFVTNSFIAAKANSNLSMDKDIFKVKFPYSEQFWKSQNQLPLTIELKDFLQKVLDKKENKKDFEIVGNF
ncbi:carboxypeptidase-like regulatory domain-containing protein [Flavobacterium foetidum]|uniref:carboxypeptidase-like regulatory domain-containing protein n=1 Tax=Flavobacterium foetidum TaxID=2026681 RepID=UPI001074EEBF|nr:carboxypeptidase-like regulatory domain-containing protein [Flavobacterium foetidum]KAF2511886.1 carboxypeptidase-like regulatory domain-containing protein [Flavobacterium foetidum]